MKLEDVHALWAEDSKVDHKDIEKMDRDTLNGSSLHYKYATILSLEQRRAVKLENKKLTLLFQLEGYYRDDMYKEELQRTKSSVKIPKTKEEALRMVAIDPVMIQLSEMISESNEIILYCKGIVEYLKYNRTKAFTNHIEWLKLNIGR